MKLDVYDLSGKVTGQVDLPPELFNVEVKPEVLATALRVYSANQRQATSKVKTRGEVSLTTHKVWKQKGTGRARHGSKAAPIFVGGGVAHGPSGNQVYDLKLTKRMKQIALRGAFTDMAKNGRIKVVDGLVDLKRSTKDLANLLKAVNTDTKPTLLMIESSLPNLVGAGKNIANLTITQAKRTNVYEVLTAQTIILHKPAIDVLADTFKE